MKKKSETRKLYLFLKVNFVGIWPIFPPTKLQNSPCPEPIKLSHLLRYRNCQQTIKLRFGTHEIRPINVNLLSYTIRLVSPLVPISSELPHLDVFSLPNLSAFTECNSLHAEFHERKLISLALHVY